MTEVEAGPDRVRRALMWHAVVRWLGRVRRPMGRFGLAHGLFLVAAVAAAAIRWIATLGYPTGLWFGDSRIYVEAAVIFKPADLRPSGYPIFLWLLKPLHSFLWVVGVQHALGVGIAVMIYALIWRAARAAWPRWLWLPGILGTLCTLPVLFDAYEIQLEHLLMADLLFAFLLVAGVTVLLWPARIRWWTGAAAGLLIACGALVRSVGLPLLLLVIVYLLVRRVGWRTIVAAVVAAAIPLVIYMSWFNSVHGKFAITTTTQVFLYGRTTDFAKCDVIKPRPEVAVFCRDHLPPDPVVAPGYNAVWGQNSPFYQFPGWVRDPEANKLAGEFAREAIMKQPGDYLATVWRDTFRAFEWERKPYPTPWTANSYKFRSGASLKLKDASVGFPYGGRTAEARVVEPYGDWMREYQSAIFMPGRILGYLLLAGLAGIVIRIRRGGGQGLLPWAVSVSLLVVPAATADFDYRYVLPAAPFALLAAGLALIPGPRKAATTRPAPPPYGAQKLLVPLLLPGTAAGLPKPAARPQHWSEPLSEPGLPVEAAVEAPLSRL